MSNDRYLWENGDKLEVITNDDLVCENCVFRTDNFNTCMVYEIEKPKQVIMGGKCEHKKLLSQF